MSWKQQIAENRILAPLGALLTALLGLAFLITPIFPLLTFLSCDALFLARPTIPVEEVMLVDFPGDVSSPGVKVLLDRSGHLLQISLPPERPRDTPTPL